MTPSLSLAQSGSDQGGNRSVPKKEREIHDVDFRVVNWVFHIWLTLTGQLCGDSFAARSDAACHQLQPMICFGTLCKI